MDTSKYMLIAGGKFVTASVRFCQYNHATHKYDILFDNGKTYSYAYHHVTWLKNPEVLIPDQYRLSHNGTSLHSIADIRVFRDTYQNYWHIRFQDGREHNYTESELTITVSCLNSPKQRHVYAYLKQIAELVSIRTEDGVNLLSQQYDRLDFVSTKTALSAYLNPQQLPSSSRKTSVPIFPFGCNASQVRAVKSALESPLSVIQGPPGTGKTQTILNIIANLLISGQTVQVVSNNNSATANILEKLASPKYGMDFVVAPLGNAENKAAFISHQTGFYPDLRSWRTDAAEEPAFLEKLQAMSVKIEDVFTKQERLAAVRQELASLELEMQYFSQYTAETDMDAYTVPSRKRLRSDVLMNLWQECQAVADQEATLSAWFRIKSRWIYGIADRHFYRQDIARIIAGMQQLYYSSRHQELVDELDRLQQELGETKVTDLIEDFRDMSMQYLRHYLFQKYGERHNRPVFSAETLWKDPASVLREYPVVLSTTFSSRSSLGRRAEYEYLIMDEASQVDVATGALAMSCAKNAVIVGDAKQLPNVVTDTIRKRAEAIFQSFHIPEGYNFAQNSFLRSICLLFPDVPQTLLREHYRCHPKIIGFCNEKFYGGELLVMTEDHHEKNVISAIRTVKGNHERDHYNQRQIDIIRTELLPKITADHTEIGIIAPYNHQVEALKRELDDPAIEVATVHKFQGREKDTIILTTVDDEITDFTDDPYLLNVAVSRAKKQLYLVTSGNEQVRHGNIDDLVDYIAYNNFDVQDSTLYSVFDYLYRQYTESRFAFLKKHKRISAFDSENLMYALIKEVLADDCFSTLDVVCHQPLNMLIRDPYRLNDDECRYAMNSATHLDFLIYSRISKRAVLAVEVDGYHYHKEGTIQARRDKMKNHILDLYNIPYLRFATNGSNEKEKLMHKLNELLEIKGKTL